MNPIAARAFPVRASSSPRRLSIAIVSFELVGFWKNGGIGTVSTGLAELLSAAGHQVTVAFTRADMLTREEFDRAAQRYTAQGITVVGLRRAELPPLCGPLEGFTGWERYAADWFLSQHAFDVVHASEHLGELLYALAKKSVGLAFPETQFWVGCHGPSHWVIQANGDAVRDAFWLWTDASERFCIEYSDVVWAPNDYILNWMANDGFRLPAERCFKQPYRIPNDLGEVGSRDPEAHKTRREVTELVFFGRLEPRKGIKLFLEALAAIRARLQSVQVTFMGRLGSLDGRPADKLIAERSAALGISWQILSDFDRHEAYEYVTKPGRLVVMAAPVDNSPCAVYELLEIRAHFIACRGGGVPDLIAPESQEDVLFDYTLQSITERITDCLVHGSIAPLPAFDRSWIEMAWLAAHEMIPETCSSPPPVRAKVPDTILAAVLHDGNLAALEATVVALRRCACPRVEVILAISDRRAVLPGDAFPELARFSVDETGPASLLRALADRGLPVLVLREGAHLDAASVARLALAGASADAVVPFAEMRRPDGGLAIEPTLSGSEPWSLLYGTARIGGLLSAFAISQICEMPLPGSNILIWFDAAVAAGLTVMPLAEPLLNGCDVDQTTHSGPDERARVTFWTERMAPSQRLLMEAAYGFLAPSPHEITSPPVAASTSSIPLAERRAGSDRRPARLGGALRSLFGRNRAI
jgi:hypothetical protein